MVDELVQEFLVESFDLLEELDQFLLTLEEDPNNHEVLANVFRNVHTIKGTCGFLGYKKLESVTHNGENLLSKAREGIIKFSPAVVTVVFELLDAMRAMLTAIEQTENDGDNDYEELVKKLAAYTEGNIPEDGANKSSSTPAKAEDAKEPEASAAVDDKKKSSGFDESSLKPKEKKRYDEVKEALALQVKLLQLTGTVSYNAPEAEKLNAAIEDLTKLNELIKTSNLETLKLIAASVPDLLKLIVEAKHGNFTKEGKLIEEALSTAGLLISNYVTEGSEGSTDYFDMVLSLQAATSDFAENHKDDKQIPVEPEDTVKPETQSPPPATEATPKASPATPAAKAESDKAAPEKSSSLANASLRVDVGLLDTLMNLVGELVLVRNQSLQFANNFDDVVFQNTVQRLDQVTSELQEGVMKTRMQPISNIWSKFPRVVRDLARQCGKKVKVEMEGKETELDKTIIESIKDPLTHMIRNSVDHGVETPEERVAAGKVEEGTIILRAFHEGGQVIIELEDNGKGLDPERIRQKVVEKGLKTRAEVDQISDAEAIKMIFLPGFSTAQQVTNVSGRGVGMDVVRTNIEKIGGVIDLNSTPGEGTTVILKIPLTLAIIPALMVTCGHFKFAISQVSLQELVRIQGEQITKEIEHIQNSSFYRLRGNLIPLISLSDILKIPGSRLTGNIISQAKEQGKLNQLAFNIIVLKADKQVFGLIVDDVNDTEEIVVKPLGRHFKDLPIYAGATILGNGQVALILDVLGIAEKGNLVSQQAPEEVAMVDTIDQTKETILVFDVDQQGNMGIPLKLIDRLEEFSAENVEKVGANYVTQYRGDILPLIDLPGYFGTPTNISDKLPVIIYTRNNRNVGLIVKDIKDIVEDEIIPEKAIVRPGIVYSAIIKGRVTEFLDVLRVIESDHPGFFDVEN